MSDRPLDSEIKLRAIVLFGVGLVAIMVVMTALMWWMSVGLRSHLESDDPAPAALPEARQQQRPDGPVLQGDPIGDLTRMRAEENAVLEQAEWANEGAGLARLPIDFAIEAVAAAGEIPSLSGPESGAESP